MASSSNLRGWRPLGTCKLELRTSWLLRVPLDWVPWGLFTFTFSFMAPYCTKFRDAEQCVNSNKSDKRHKERKHTKDRFETMPEQRTSCTIQGLSLPIKSGGTSTYDDSPKEPYLTNYWISQQDFNSSPGLSTEFCDIITPFSSLEIDAYQTLNFWQSRLYPLF